MVLFCLFFRASRSANYPIADKLSSNIPSLIQYTNKFRKKTVNKLEWKSQKVRTMSPKPNLNVKNERKKARKESNTIRNT